MSKLAFWMKRRCRWLYNLLRYLYEKLGSIWIEMKAVARGMGIGGKEYKKLQALKNKYEGERCFIIATGPSLTMDDLEALKNEYTLGMNSICMLYDKTAWRATYMGVQDGRVYDKIRPYLEKYCDSNVFISDGICRDQKKRRQWILFPYNGKYHAYDEVVHNKFWAKFSDDCYRLTYDGYSITYSLIEIACYLGFQKIYLLGADCNFEPGKKLHFVEHDIKDSSYEFTRERNLCGYRKAKEFADKRGIQIYNATRGGKLEVFSRVDFDDILLK